jgi:hypothetical protein
MSIEIQQANLKTVSVNIQVLKVGAKQMTLSVFRQLDQGDVFNEWTGELEGAIWGRVNYQWSGHEEHLHLVWQQGTNLRRACLPASLAFHRPRLAIGNAAHHLRIIMHKERGGGGYKDEERDGLLYSLHIGTGDPRYLEATQAKDLSDISKHCDLAADRVARLYRSFHASIEALPHLFIAV